MLGRVAGAGVVLGGDAVELPLLHAAASITTDDTQNGQTNAHSPTLAPPQCASGQGNMSER